MISSAALLADLDICLSPFTHQKVPNAPCPVLPVCAPVEPRQADYPSDVPWANVVPTPRTKPETHAPDPHADIRGLSVEVPEDETTPEPSKRPVYAERQVFVFRRTRRNRLVSSIYSWQGSAPVAHVEFEPRRDLNNPKNIQGL